MKTLIRGRWVVGYRDGGHVVIPNGEVVYEGNTVEFVGRDYDGPIDRRVDADNKLVIPGLISTHLHSDVNAGDYTFLDETRIDMWGRNYLNWQAGIPGARRRAADHTTMTFGLAQALRSGVTTVVEIGCGAGPVDEFTQVVDELGLRVYTGPSYRDVSMSSTAEGRIHYDHVAGRGRAGLKRAIAFAAEYDGTSDGRLRAILCPGHPDTCDYDVLETTAESSRELGIPVTIHGAINIPEVFHIFDQYGCSPIELLHRAGLLRPDVIIGHGIFITGHSGLPGEPGHDLELLGDAGATISHSPYKYLHLGYVMESFQRYTDRGANMTIGTDFSPSDILAEMRYAVLGSRVADGSFRSGAPRDVFNAATVNAARALGRADLGRLELGSKADITIVDLDRFRFGAVHDPIKTLVEQASGSDVDTVIVDGRTLIESGRFVVLDEARLLQAARVVAEESWSEVPSWSWAARSIDDMVPPSFPSA